jgi:hypothetical protein
MLRDDGSIDIPDLPVVSLEQIQGELEELSARGILPPWIAGREIGSDVTERRRSQKSVDNRMEQDIGIGVPGQSSMVGNNDPSEYERADGVVRRESMHVIAHANPRDVRKHVGLRFLPVTRR